MTTRAPTQTLTPLTGKILDPLNILRYTQLRPGMHIADFGAGHGHFTLPAAQLTGEYGTVHAVDIQSDLLHAVQQQARSRGYTNVKTIHADLERFGSTKIANGMLDMVLMINNQIEAPTHAQFLKEAARISRPGAMIILIDWVGGRTNPYAEAIYDRIPREVALTQAAGLGLRFVDEFRPGRYHYGLKVQKV